MCQRYCLTLPPEAVRQIFRLATIDPFPQRYNISPMQPVGIVRRSLRNRPEFWLVRWGLIPSWVKTPTDRALITARAETAADKPSFRGSLRHRRCLVPACGYYEWSGKAGAKVPHLIRPRGGGVLGLAGLWEHWVGADGSELETMAILTIAANAALTPIHERMPVIIAEAQQEAWLDCRSGSAVGISHLLAPPPEDLLEAVALTPAVNDPRRDGLELHVPATKRLL